MKPVTFLCFSYSLFLWSCDRQDCEPNTITTSFDIHKEINVDFDTTYQVYIYGIDEGQNLVFQHVYYNGHCEGSADDWSRTTLSFEIPADSTSFVLKDATLVTSDCFVHLASTWLHEDFPVIKGIIEGQQLSSDEWRLNGSINYTIPLLYLQKETISFDEIFRKK